MEEIEYLEEYEDLILPTIQSNSGEVDDFQTSRSSNMMQDEDSSSIDQDIFESLFDDHSEDESSNILQKKADPKLSQRGSDDRASLDSLDMLVKDLVGEQNSQKKSSQPTKTNTNTSLSSSKVHSQLQKKMTTSTPSSSSAVGRSMQKVPTSSSSSTSLLKGRPSGGSLTKLPMPRSSLGLQKRPGSNASSDATAMMSTSSQKQKPSSLSHGARIDMQHKFDKSKSVATVRPTVQQKQQQHMQQQRRFPPASGLNRNQPSSSASSSRSSSGLVTLSARKNMSMPSNRGGPSTRGGATTRGGMAPRQLQRPQTTIIKPEKREMKDPSEDPLTGLDDIAEALLDSDSDSFSLSDISDESMDSMSDMDEDSQNVIDISNDSSIDTKNNHKELENIRRDTPSPTVSEVDKDDNSLSPLQSKSKSNKVDDFKHPSKQSVAKTNEAKQNMASLLGNDVPMVAKKPAAEKVTIISDTLLTRIDSALLDTALMDDKNPADNEYCNQTNEDVVAALERELMPFLKKKNSTDNPEEDMAQEPTVESTLPVDTTNSTNLLDELAEAVFGMDNDIIEDKSNEKLDKRHLELNRADSNKSNLEADSQELNLTTEQENTDNLNNKENEQVPTEQCVDESHTAEEAETEESTINETNDIIEESHVEYEEFNDQLDDEIAMEVEVETIKDGEAENADVETENADVETENADAEIENADAEIENANVDFNMDLASTEAVTTTNEQQSQEHHVVDGEGRTEEIDEGLGEVTTEAIDEGFGEVDLPTTKTSEHVENAQAVPSSIDEANTTSKDKEDAASTSSIEKLEDANNPVASLKRNKRKRCNTSESSSSEKSVSTKTTESIKKVFKEPVNPSNSQPSKDSTNTTTAALRKRNLRSPALNDKSREASPAPPTKKYKLDTESKSRRSSRSTDTSESELETHEPKVFRPKTKTESNEVKTNKSTGINSTENAKTSKTNEQESKISTSSIVQKKDQKEEKGTHNKPRAETSISTKEATTKKDDVDKKSYNLHENPKEERPKAADTSATPSKQVVAKDASSHIKKPLVSNKTKLETIKKPISTTENEGTPTKFPKVDRPQKLKVMVSKHSAQSTTKDVSTNKDKINKQPAEKTKETIATTSSDDTSKTEESQEQSGKDDAAKDSLHSTTKLKLKRFTTSTEKDLKEETIKDSEKRTAEENVEVKQKAKESHKPTSTTSTTKAATTKAATTKASTTTPTTKASTTTTQTTKSSTTTTPTTKASTIKASTTTAPTTKASTTIVRATEVENKTKAADKEEHKNVEKKTETPTKKLPPSKTKTDDGVSKTIKEQTAETLLKISQQKETAVKEQHVKRPSREESTERIAADDKQKNIAKITQKNVQNVTRTPQKKTQIEANTQENAPKTQQAAKQELNVVQSSQKTTRAKPTEETATATTTTTTKTTTTKKDEKQQNAEESKKNTEKQPENKQSELSQKDVAAKVQNKNINNSLISQKVSENSVVTRRVAGKQIKTTENAVIKVGQQKIEEQPQQQVKKIELVKGKKEQEETGSVKTDAATKESQSNEKTNITVTKAVNKNTTSVGTTQKISSGEKNTPSKAQPSKTEEKQEHKEVAANEKKSEITTQPAKSVKDSRSALPAKVATNQKKPQTPAPKVQQTSISKKPEGTQPVVSSAKVTKVLPAQKTKEEQETKQAAASQKKPLATASKPDSTATEAKEEQELKQASTASQNKSAATQQTKQASATQQPKQASAVGHKQAAATQPITNVKEVKSVASPKATATQKKPQTATHTINVKKDTNALPSKDKEDKKLNEAEENTKKPETTQPASSAKPTKEQEEKQVSDNLIKKPQITQQISSSSKEAPSSVPTEVAGGAEKVVPAAKTATTPKRTQATQPASRAKEVKEPALQQTSDSPQKAEPTQQLNSAKKALPPKSVEQEKLTSEEKPKETNQSINAKQAKTTEPPKTKDKTQELKQEPSSFKQEQKPQEKQEEQVDLQDSAEEKSEDKTNVVVEKKAITESPLPTRKSLRTKVLTEKEEATKSTEALATTETPKPTLTTTAATPTTDKIVHSHGTRKAIKLRVAETPPPHAPRNHAPTPTPPTTTTVTPQHIHGTRKAIKAKLVQEHQTVSSTSKPLAPVTAQSPALPETPAATQQRDLPTDPTNEVTIKKHEITPAVTRRSFKLQVAKSPEKQPSEIAGSVRTYPVRKAETTRKMLVQTPTQATKSKSTGTLSFKEWKEGQRRNHFQSNSKEQIESTTKSNETLNVHDKLDTSVELVLDVAVHKLTTATNETEALDHNSTAKVSNEVNIDLDMSEDNKPQTQITTQQHISEKIEILDDSVPTKLDDSKVSPKQLGSTAVATPNSEANKNHKKGVCHEVEHNKNIEENAQQILEEHTDKNALEAEAENANRTIESNTPSAEGSEKISPKAATNSPSTKDDKDNATKTTTPTSQSLPKKKRPRSELESLMESLPKFLEASIYLTKRRRRDANSLSPTRAASTRPQANNRTQFKTPTAPHTIKAAFPTRAASAANPFSGAVAVAPAISIVTRRSETKTASHLNKSYPLKVLDMSPVKSNPFATATVTTTATTVLPENKIKADKLPEEKLHKCRKVRVCINRSIFRKYQRSLLLKLRSKITKPAQTQLQTTGSILSVKSDDHLPAADIATEPQIDNSLLKLCHTLNALSAPMGSTMRASSPIPSVSSSQTLNKNQSEAYITTAEDSVNLRTAIEENDIGHHLRSSSMVMHELAMSAHSRHQKPDDTCAPEILQEQFQHSSSGTLSAQEDENERISPNSHMINADDSLLTPLKSSTQASAMARQQHQQQQQQQQQQKRSARLQQQSTLKQQTQAATLQTQQPQQITVKPTSTLQNKQHQQEQAIFTPIVPKKELEDETQTPTASGNLPTAPATAASSLLNGGVPAAIVDNSGTRLYSFLHPSKYNRSHGAVLLDYCCPNLDGPMPAIDPTREHAQLQSLVRELPAYIVMTTKVVTRADLEAKNNSIPASIRKKMEKLTSVAGAASTAAAQAAVNRTPTLQALIAKGPQPPPPPTHPIAGTAVPSVTAQVGSGAAAYTSSISALQKQLPSTTTLTPKLPPMALSESLPPLTPFSALSSAAHGSGASAAASRPPLKPEFMRAVLRSNLRRFDTMLQKYSPRISELTYVDRQRIIDGIVHQTTLNSQDVEQATRLLDEYCQLVNNMPVTKSAISLNTTPTVNTATPTTVSTTPTAYAGSAANQNTSLTTSQAVAAQQLEQIHANVVQKVRTAGTTSLQAKRQVPIYDKDRNIIGYQMHNVPATSASSTNSTLSTRVGIMSSTRQRLSNPATGTPTATLKQPAQESPRIFYTKPIQTSTPINNNNGSASAAYEAASRLSRSVTIRQVPTKSTTQLNNTSSPRMPTLSKMPNMSGKQNTSSGTQRITTITTSNPTTPNTATTKTNITLSTSTLAPITTKRITRHTATTREGQILIITKDKDGNVGTGTHGNDAESILPDEERSAAELKEIKREKDDDGFIGAS